MKESKIKTVLIDDEQIAIDRLKVLLKHFPEIQILKTTTNALNSVELISSLEPDLVFLDVEMPGKTGLEVAETLKKQNCCSKIIFTTSYDHYAIEAIRNNAFDYILKPVSIKVLKEVIERYKSNLNSILSQRELSVLHLVTKGLSSKEIADKLFISKHTVDTHRRNILHKTNCKNATELINYTSSKNI